MLFSWLHEYVDRFLVRDVSGGRNVLHIITDLFALVCRCDVYVQIE